MCLWKITALLLIFTTTATALADNNVKFLGQPTDNFNATRDVMFLLFTRFNSEPHAFHLDTADTLFKSFFNSTWPLRILVHGYLSDANAPVIRSIKEAYLNHGDYNVIGVDWSKGAKSSYFKASQNTVPVGLIIAEFIDTLVATKSLSFSDIYMIGHSLGAHASGIAGKNMKLGKINTIVGLDPASINYSVKEPHLRIDAKDAEYVEIIHTNTKFYGFSRPIGTTDFYVNYGGRQAGCRNDDSCSHGRSVEFFIESIASTKGFWSFQCGHYDEIRRKKCNAVNDQVKMGGDPSNNGRAKGVFYLVTNSESPYALGYNKFIGRNQDINHIDEYIES